MRSRVEHEILFLIGRRDPGAKLRDLLRQDVDWEYLFLTASYHGLIPLLHKHVEPTIPINVLSRLKLQSVSNTQNVLHLLGKQLKLHRLFQDNNVPLAILKGSVLSQMAYGEISLRQAGDIDVLISRADFHRARQLLESLGYQMTPALTATQLSSHLASHCEIQFVRDDWFTVVDLHWALAPKNFVFKVETSDVLSRLQRVSIPGPRIETEIQTLCTEDLILYLSMHGAKHLWRAVEWITSLGELIRAAESIAWETVIQRAENAHATRMLALGLRLVERVSDVELPAEVLQRVDAGESMKRTANELVTQIFTNWGAADSTETNLNNLKIMDRKRDALISALRAIFVPTISDWSALNLPPSLHSLYFAYRPLRLSKIYTASLWRKLSSKGACW